MQDDNRNNTKAGKNCGLFQPMFGDTSDRLSAEGEAEDLQCALERARQTGYDNGYEHGRQEAVELARKSMAPTLNDLFRSLERIDTYNHQLTEQAADHIIKLAVAIAGQILEQIPTMNTETIPDAGKTLQKTIAAAHELTLRLHPETAAALEALVQSNGLSWPAGEFVRLADDPELDCNALRLETKPQQMEIMRSQADACLKSLVKNV